MGKTASQVKIDSMVIDDPDEWEDLPAEELENAEDAISDQASAARTIDELQAEIATLKRLERMANDVRMSGEDRKWDELSQLLQDNERMYDQSGRREKLIIFTEHRDNRNVRCLQRNRLIIYIT